jgi:intracellular septation protein A
MDSGSDARQTTGASSAMRGRLRSIAMIVIFDIAAPLLAYNWLRSAGLSTVTALILSGVFPALGVTIGAVRHRRLDVIGAVVLAGIIVGTVLGLVSHNAKLVLIEGSVPTVVFGVACLGSLWARRPFMFTLVLEFVGPDTAKGREMTLFWQHEGFRHSFRVITATWGVGFLIEAALRVVIVYNTSTGTALAISKITPFLFAGIMVAWTLAYTAHQKKKYERIAAAGEVAEAAGEVTRVSPEAAGPSPATQAPIPTQSPS